MQPARLDELAAALIAVPGVEAVLLGGSRARGTHTENSDVDLGLCYRGPLDVAALGALAREWSGPDAVVTAPGGWGPWVDGGGWLRIDGVAVDWLYRDLDRVRRACAAATAGAVTWHFQAGHPLGFPDIGYAAELAAGVVLADPTGAVATLRAQLDPYPPALQARLIAGLDEAEFLLGAVGKVVPRGDTAYLAGVFFRVIGLCAHAVHAAAAVWITNEKGSVRSADSLLPGFAAAVDAIYAALPSDPAAALGRARALRATTLVHTRKVAPQITW